ncbi:hypothetical protein Tco_1417511 [Tanacetum coccineum]
MGYEKIPQKLMFYKAFFSPQWKFLIHTVLQSLSAKTTAWNKFSIIMASAIICVATNHNFNFLKFIFEGMLRNLDNIAGKFLMYPRKPKKKVTEVPQHSEPSHVADKAVHKDWRDRLVRAATTASSLEAKQDSGNIAKTQSKATPNKPGSQGTSSGGGLRIESSEEEDLGEDASKHGRINYIDADANITLVSPFVNEDDVEMFDKEEDVALSSAKDGVNDAAGVTKTVSVAAQSTTAGTTVEEVTLAQTLQKIKSTTPKSKGVVIPGREQGISKRTQTSAQPQDKGKAKMIEPVKHKMKDQIRLDKDTALRLQAEFDKEARLANEEAENVKKPILP